MAQRRLEDERDQALQEVSSLEIRLRERESSLELQLHNVNLENSRLNTRVQTLEVKLLLCRDAPLWLL